MSGRGVSNDISAAEEGMNSDERKNSAQSTQGEFVCDECGRSLSSRGSLYLHKRIHTGEKPYECTYCGTSFARNGHLTVHLRKHTGEKPYSCSYCGRSFVTNSNLTIHLRIHTGERPYSCSHCGRMFSQNVQLHSHIRTQTGGGPYQCTKCAESFETKCSLNKHESTHGKPHKCNGCEKSFTKKCNLNQHMLIHTGEKPFKCNYCEKSFTQKAHVASHEQRIHKKEKQYRCNHCKRPFSKLNSYERHVQLHTSLEMLNDDQRKSEIVQKFDFKQYLSPHGKKVDHTCNKCGLIFLFKSGLNRHFSSHLNTNTKPPYFNYGKKALKTLRIWRICSQKHKSLLRNLLLRWRTFNWNSATVIDTTKAFYKCIRCSQNFYRPLNFIDHMRRHKDEEPLEYKVADRVYKDYPIELHK